MQTKTKWFIIIVLLASSIVGYTFFQKNKDYHANDYLHTLSYDEYQNQPTDGDAKILYFGSEICGDSQAFINWMIPKNQNNMMLMNKLLYIDVSQQQSNKELWEAFKTSSTVTGTPTLIYVQDGIEIDRIAWKSNEGFPEEQVQRWLDEKLQKM